MTRRAVVPVFVIAMAVILGVFVIGPAHVKANPRSVVLVSDSAPNSSAALAAGQTLFEETCSTCHGSDAGGSALAPNLRGVGAAVVDLWVSSGWMPLRNPTSQPIKKPAAFDRQQTVEIANYVGSLAGGPSIPKVNLKGANAAAGFSIFALNCAPCHTITGAGDALSDGITAPPLHGLAPTEIAEAIETGPGNMPHFSATEIPKSQVNDLVAYVSKNIEHPSNPGGLSLGGVGPVAEGFIGLFVGVGLCMLLALWIGDRTEPDEEDEAHGHETHGAEHA